VKLSTKAIDTNRFVWKYNVL